MDKEDFYNWEKMSLARIITLMVKWFGFPSVNMQVHERDNVESGIWYELKIEHSDLGQINTSYISGQRSDVVRRRLIEFLDQLDIRKDYLKENAE